MIVQWFMDAIAWLAHSVFSVMPAVAIPSWFLQSTSVMSGLFTDAQTMGVWLPIPLAVTVATLLFASIMGGALIKLARIVLSLFTAGGGSAA
jgi:hypothetical protein